MIKKNKYIEWFLLNNKNGSKTREKSVEKNHPDLYEEIIKYNEKYKFGDIHFTQKLYNYLYDITEIPKCLSCGKEIKWINRFSEGYGKTCSYKCSLNINLNKIKEKHGVEHYSQTDEWKEKYKKTSLEKYGEEHIFKTQIFKDNLKTKMKEKHGVEYYSQTDEWNKKYKKTSLEKYGEEHIFKTDKAKIKLKNTITEKYGYDSIMNVPEFKQKNAETRSKETIEKIIDFLDGNNVKIEISGDSYIVHNNCEKHQTYEIKKSLLYNRIFNDENASPCIICNPINSPFSLKEKELTKFIKELDINYIENYRKILSNSKELDIYLPDHKIGIEFNGLYWHSDLFLDKLYHLNKLKECEEKGIKLIHIFEDEWNFKKDIVKSILKNKLKISQNKIFARKCNVKIVSTKETKEFLTKNHLQGYSVSKINIGLYYNSQLISLMTFSNLRRGNNRNKDSFEMIRYANKIDTVVIGGASKLFNYFVTNYNPIYVETFADKRYSNGKLYEILGFDFIGDTKVNYWYFLRGDGIRYNRLNFNKKLLLKEGHDINLTEREIMIKKGYNRIYDCGNKKYVWSRV
ncbi:MAG: DUF7487 domain-containing protein [bacterium]